MPNAGGPRSENVTYAAFLRGINVGGHRRIKMPDLRAACEAQGFTGVKTVLASGNIRFDSVETDASLVRRTLEHLIRQEFGHEIPVLVRRVAVLQRLVEADPFKEMVSTPQTKLYVTFLPQGQTESAIPLDDLTLESFTIVHATSDAVCSVLTLSQAYGTIEFMAHLERLYGPSITTRTWNTITRLLGAK